MPNLALRLACWEYDRTRPLIDGRVKPEGIDLTVEVLRPQAAFRRMLDGEVEVGEMSLAAYTTLKARGECPLVAIPVALSKMFRHSCLYVRPEGIREPADLKGKRIGIEQFGSTAAVYIRGMLEHEHGVRTEDVHWLSGGLAQPAPRSLVPLSLPERIRLEPIAEGQTLEGLLEAGELDGVLSILLPRPFLRGEAWIARLFPNFKEVEQAYYRRTGIFPVMHVVAIREELHREQPWVAESLYGAFCAARDLALEGLYDTDALRLALPWLIDHLEEARAVFGEDFWVYGLEANRPALEAIGQYVFEQGLAPRTVRPEELFVEGIG
jgi:4,5-dihydroxyphthalate decarboxylase